MKKIILFLLIITSLFIKPNIDVKADAFSPIITAYEAIVTNPNGAKTYNGYWIDSNNNNLNDFIIPYNSEIIVISEESDVAKVKYNSKEYYISLADISLKNEEFALSNATHLDSPKKVLTTFEINMYFGPSTKFKKVTSIPKETELSYEYMIKGQWSEPSWIYVKHNNYKGWIQFSGGKYNNVATEANYNVVLLQDLNLDNQHVEKGTVLKCLYNLDRDYEQLDYVSYNNKIVEISYDFGSPKVEKTDAVIEQPSEPAKTEEQKNTDEQTIPDNKPNEEETKIKQQDSKSDYTTIIYLCIGAAVLIALTSMVTIILVNKRNKSKASNEPHQVVNEENEKSNLN